MKRFSAGPGHARLRASSVVGEYLVGLQDADLAVFLEFGEVDLLQVGEHEDDVPLVGDAFFRLVEVLVHAHLEQALVGGLARLLLQVELLQRPADAVVVLLLHADVPELRQKVLAGGLERGRRAGLRVVQQPQK